MAASPCRVHCIAGDLMILQALRSRTVWLGIVVAVLSVLQGFVVRVPVSPLVQAGIGIAIAVAIVILRFLTFGRGFLAAIR